jgi:hypothetical protein
MGTKPKKKKAMRSVKSGVKTAELIFGIKDIYRYGKLNKIKTNREWF